MSVDRRKQIVEAATKSFAFFGYKATTMEQVAKIAGVGKGTIYTFFAQKEELFDEIMHNFIVEMRQIAEKVMDPQKPLFDNLHPLLYELLDFRRKHELTIRLSHEVKEMGTPKAQEGMRQIEQAILAFVQKKVQEALDKGEIKTCDPEITAFVIVKLYVAFVHDWEKLNPPLSNEKIAELFQTYIVEGLAVK
ncbi:TetR/AcrR family transcriptional regulator [Paenibacillus contaminans]|uniref:TetR/AcrR family transcriptional regulator n=1 Tax=Paenibacillus contaminans TaxID=450362 RepID=A0A329MFP7_9BACL|nr:TetR/AcrR family transcriptional regulator [Paenibacillus contaminans]RAV16057.1 TetR/AcrR family transcriptional regulator [Paenibacillus contaminans]